jgi:type IV pilus assembly protein PilA
VGLRLFATKCKNSGGRNSNGLLKKSENPLCSRARLRIAAACLEYLPSRDGEAIPNLLQTRVGAAETVVIREIQTIHQAQIQYQSQFGKYASTLVELGPPAGGAAGPAAANLIPASLASGEKDGYVFTIIATTAGFEIHANPRIFGSSGRRTFYLDENGAVRQNWGQEPATASSPEIR